MKYLSLLFSCVVAFSVPASSQTTATQRPPAPGSATKKVLSTIKEQAPPIFVGPQYPPEHPAENPTTPAAKESFPEFDPDRLPTEDPISNDISTRLDPYQPTPAVIGSGPGENQPSPSHPGEPNSGIPPVDTHHPPSSTLPSIDPKPEIRPIASEAFSTMLRSFTIPTIPFKVTTTLSSYDGSVSNQAIANSSVLVPIFNGFPTFCSYDAMTRCAGVPLMHCARCSMPTAGFFAFAIVVLAFAIIFANALVIWVFVKGKSLFVGSYVKIKISLAVADLFTGIFLLVVTLPNFGLTVTMTPEQLFIHTMEQHGSAWASVGGVLYLLLFSSSLYHLVFLAQQRFYAIMWPTMYKLIKDRSVNIGIAVVWLLAFLASVSPLWFPNSLVFAYTHLTYLFDVTTAEINYTSNYTPMLIFLLVIFAIPFLCLACLSAITGYLTARFVDKSSQMTVASRKSAKEMRVFATLAVMQVGFTLTLLPLFVATVLSYTRDLENESLAVPYVTCFYLSLSNSLVNVIVYTVVDLKFRNSVRGIFSTSARLHRKRKARIYGSTTIRTNKSIVRLSYLPSKTPMYAHRDSVV